MNDLSYPQKRKLMRNIREHYDSDPTQHLTAQQVHDYENGLDNLRMAGVERMGRGMKQVRPKLFEGAAWFVLGAVTVIVIIIGVIIGVMML